MNQISTRPIAVSYSRFSSGKQAKGSSIDRQTKAFLMWLADHRDYEVLAFEDKGVSAFTGRHASKAGLSRVLDLVHSGRLKQGDCLVIESMDRLSRQEVTDSLELVQEILKSGVRIVTLEDGQVYDRSSLNDSRAFILLANLQAAHSYSKRLGERVSAAHEAKRQKARAKESLEKVVTAVWIKNGRIVEPYASLVKKAVRLYLSGLGHRAISIELRSYIEGEIKLAERYQKPIQATTIKRWLRSPELIGDWDSKAGLIQGAFEPLISHLEYQQIQNELKRRSKKPTKQATYLLSGLVMCGECKSSFHTRKQKPKPTRRAAIGSSEYLAKRPILYCNCSNYLKNGSCLNNGTWPYEVLLFILWYGLYTPIKKLQEEGRPDKTSLVVQQLNKTIEELKAKSTRSEDLYIATGDQIHLNRVKELKQEIESLSFEIGKCLEAEAVDLEQDENVAAFQRFNELSEVEQNRLLKRFSHFIQVSKDGATLLSSFTEPTFSLVKRSQKHKVYFVKVVSKEEAECETTKYFAVDKLGRTIFPTGADTIEELVSDLELITEGKTANIPTLGIFE